MVSCIDILGDASMRNGLNFLWYQLFWWVIIGSVSWGYLWHGMMLGLVLIGVHLFFSSQRRVDLWWMVVSFIVGCCLESLLLWWGCYRFSDRIVVHGFLPAWLCLLWLGFGCTFSYSMAWIKQPLLAVLGFSVGGLLVYLGVDRLGIIQFNMSGVSIGVFMGLGGLVGLGLGIRLKKQLV